MKAYTVKTLAAEWQCGEGLVRKAINDGKLGCFRLGTLIRIPSEEVRRFECQNIASSGSGMDGPSSIVTRASVSDAASMRPIGPGPRPRRVPDGARMTGNGRSG